MEEIDAPDDAFGERTISKQYGLVSTRLTDMMSLKGIDNDDAVAVSVLLKSRAYSRKIRNFLVHRKDLRPSSFTEAQPVFTFLSPPVESDPPGGSKLCGEL